MKRIVTFIIAVMTMATIQGQTMTERQKGLAACACLMAQGDLERLEPAVTTGISTTKQYKYSSVSVVVAGIRNGARMPSR